MIFIDSTGKRVNIHAPYQYGGTTYGNLTNPDIRAICGISEIQEPQQPEDFDYRYYYVTEQDFAPYVVYTKKSDEQIKEIKISELKSKIDAMEREQMLPRLVREFTLTSVQIQAAAAGLDPMENFAYRKLKEFDDSITALRTEMDALNG